MTDEARSFFESLPGRVSPEKLAGVSAIYVFELSEGGAWTVRIENGGLQVSEGVESAADCTITASEEIFRQLVDRELNPVSAYLTGKLRIRGDLGTATRLSELFSP